MANLHYEGQVRVDGKKADGSDLIISKGDRKGEPYYKVSFKVGDEWVNLMDFNGITHGQGGDFRVDYYQKFQPNGEPDLYNGKPQYALVDIAPLTQQTTASPQASTPQTTSAPLDRDESIRSQTTLKVVGEIYASHIVVTNKPFDPEEFSNIYHSVKSVLDGKPKEQDAYDRAAQEFEAAGDDDETIPF